MGKDTRVIEEFSYTIDRNFDKVGIFTTFEELPIKMGRADWPDDLKPDVIGTPVDIRKYNQKVMKESVARKNRGERDEYHIAIWVDGIWFTEGTLAMLYYIIDASYSGNKPYVLEGTHLVDKV